MDYGTLLRESYYMHDSIVQFAVPGLGAGAGAGAGCQIFTVSSTAYGGVLCFPPGRFFLGLQFLDLVR